MLEIYYLALLHKIWINHKKLHIIFKDNLNYKEYYDNLSQNILKDIWYSDKQIEYILKEKSSNNIFKIKEVLEKRNVSIITINDNKYPEYLKHISNVPFLFYLRWIIDNSPKISVVWSRKITSYWEKAIEKIIGEISNYFVIVSWWATWCDSMSHEIAIKNNNKTISVIWTWIDIDYPVSNKKLYDTIASNWWGVISIFPVWEVWNSYNFPIRNEIVACLWVWVIVVEARIKSGTLITSNLALDLWKDLFAIPWDFNKPTSEWCNMLIKKGMAKLITCSEDVLDEYNIKSNGRLRWKNKIDFIDIHEENIYNILMLESLTVDQLAIKLTLDIPTVCLKLSMLEINNLIKKKYWWKYEVF